MMLRLRSFPVWAAIGILVVIGQSFLAIFSPMTRASRAFGGSVGPGGVALLSSDSLYYLRLAESPSLLEASPLTRVALPAILWFGAVLGSAEVFSVSLNLLALLLAGIALHRLGHRLGGTRAAGLLAAAALVVNPFVAQWARFVLTETLSYAAIVGILWAVVQFVDDRSTKALGLLVVLGSFITLLRPNGVLVFAGALGVVTLSLARGRLRRTVLQMLIWAVALTVFFVGSREPELGSERTSQLVIGLLYDGVVVEGTPEVLVTTSMPAMADPEDRSLRAAIEYSVRHPLSVARLAGLRVAHETLQLRRHYPNSVNILLFGGFALFLSFAVIGARVAPSRSLQQAAMFLAFPQVMLVAGTFAVPEARYGWTYLVTLCVWAGIGADRLLRRLPWWSDAGV